jgi:acyl-CoA thioester hydrolase
VEPYRHPLAPRYLEIDQQGVVFNAWYLAYFDDAMTAFLGDRGLPYGQLMADGYDVMLKRTEIDWSAGLRYGDAAHVAVDVAAIGTTSFTLSFDVVRTGEDGADETVCRGRTVYVMVTAPGNVKTPIPDRIRALLTGTA